MELLIIIWSIILNLSFVYVWSNKEKLKKWKPVKIKEDKNNEVELGKINGFTIFNFIYILLTSKACFELLKTLGDLSRLEIYITNHLGMKTLKEIAGFLFDSGNFITLFVGLTGMLVAIYIYAVSIDNKLKKFMLITLIGKESLFYLSFYIVILFLFGIKSIFLIGPIGYLIYRLTDSVKWVVNINSASSYKENFKYVMKNIFTEKDKNDLYEEVKKSLYSAVKNEELMEIEENRYYFNKYFDNYRKELNYISKDIEFGNVISFLNNLYEEVSFNKNSRIFQKINYLHIKIADYYFKNNDKDKFLRALMVMTKVYDYYSKDKNDNMELDVVSGFRFDTFGIYEKYKENFKEGIEWYCQKFKVIAEGIKRTVKNNDIYFFQQFTYLIGQEFKNKKEIKRDYKLLEKSAYFGILLYLKEEKVKSKGNQNLVEKTEMFIEFMKKEILNNTDLIDLIELYEFIGEEIYGWNEEYRDRLNWDEYFRIKPELIRIRFQEIRTKEEIKKLFFELLGRLEFYKFEEDNLKNKEEMEKKLLYKIRRENSFSFIKTEKNKEEEKKELKNLKERINKFKKSIGWLLGDLEKYKNKINIEEEKFKNLKEMFEGIKEKNKEEDNKSVREAEISSKKIEEMKKVLENILNNSKIIKMLKGFDKYRCKEEESKINLMGISQYMEKEYFTEIGDKSGTKAIAESYGDAQNRLIEQMIIDKLETEKRERGSIEEALNSMKGKPWIILTGIDMFSFFYAENDSTMGKILVDSDLKDEEFKKYGEILEGMYKYKEMKIPIYNFSSDKKGIYILDSDDIEGFAHYGANDEDEYDKNILKKFDDNVGYAHLKITDTKDIIKVKGKEEVLKYEFLKGDGTPAEKLEKFRQRILISFVQKGELKLRKDALVYKVEFNG